ncbi:MAG: SOS response-associated peptidase [Betaproteobacteria bacterium]|nr:MAG: SOS response-associated peptidase [Betaproteobacteria bacterium]
MCGRYALHANPEVLALQFGLQEAPEFKASYNLCPGSEILVVRADREGRRVARAHRWGLIPHWAKDPAIGNKLANARGESLAERPAFRDAFRQWRCLVPASGFYEWQTRGGRKHPWYVRPLDAELFALAGITALWRGVRSVSLITTEPNPVMRPIHDRMPVIVAPQDYAAWLDRAQRDANELMRFVRPYPAERMSAYRVSPRVSRPENDDPSLIAELAETPAQRELL